MTSDRYDLVVIGAGSGGLTAARFGARIGARVALVEKDRIGGDCTWTGCVPSKALVKAAHVAHETRKAGTFGIHAASVQVRGDGVRAYVRRAVEAVASAEQPADLDREGIDVVSGAAEFLDARRIRVGDRTLTTRKTLVTTGARARVPPIPGLDSTPYLTYERMFDLDDIPSTMTIIGGGPLGLEIAQAYGRLGASVTVIAPTLLPRDDPEAAEVLRGVLLREGVSIVPARALAVRPDNQQSVVETELEAVRGDRLLVATGRVPNVDGLALEQAGVRYSRKGIEVDDKLRTSCRSIYAAGDVIGREQFTHVAGWQAFGAARNALLPGSQSRRPLPLAWVTFTDPEIGQAGLTEEEARSTTRGRVTVHRWPLAHVDRAQSDGDTDGFIKLVTSSRGRILGATVVASRAGELVAEMNLAIARRLTAGQLADAIHPYPTYATGLQQLAGDAALDSWLASATGRAVRTLLGFTRRPPRAKDPTDA